MKFVLLLLLSFPAFADLNLDAAYQREKAFLLAQKDALVKMKSSLGQSLQRRKSEAEKDIQVKQLELSRLQLQNGELHEEYKAVEKVAKESSQMAGQLEKNSLKIQDLLQKIRGKLGLLHSNSNEADPVKKFQWSLSEAFELLEAISSESWRSHAFLDENNHLVKGEVLFHGLFSAWGRHAGKTFSLVPYNDEFLKVTNVAGTGDTYLFLPSFERTGLKATKTWKENIADAVPGLVMLIIMTAVLGLFILLARA